MIIILLFMFLHQKSSRIFSQIFSGYDQVLFALLFLKKKKNGRARVIRIKPAQACTGFAIREFKTKRVVMMMNIAGTKG